MSYGVGIDFGTTFTAAAVHRDGEQQAELVPLGDNGSSIASVVFLGADGVLVVGEAAARRAVTDPDRVVREVKRRIGDQTPVLVAGERLDAHTIAARFVRWVVDRVADREGEYPDRVAVAHPATWGRHKRALLAGALAEAGLEKVTLVTEPEAAAIAYTASQHVERGSAIGVYDLGGGTFDAAVVRQLDGGGFELAGRPDGIETLGGVDFDEALFERVRASIGSSWAALDLDDPMVVTAAAALRRECTGAKEALSADTEVTVPVLLPGVSTRVRLVRAEFEELIEAAIDGTVEALRRATESAGLSEEGLSAVLLVGGSSRIPLVAQRVSAELDRPVTVDADPKAVVALGAALSIAPSERVHALPAARMPLAILPAGEPEKPPRRSRRVLVPVVGFAAGVAAFLALGGTVAPELLPGSDGSGSAESGEFAANAGEPGTWAPGRAAAKEGAVDPWTGQPYTQTSAPGPERPGAEASVSSPLALSPGLPPGDDRDALVAGAKPTPAGGNRDPATPSGNSSNPEDSGGTRDSTADGTGDAATDPTGTGDPTTDPTGTGNPTTDPSQQPTGTADQPPTSDQSPSSEPAAGESPPLETP